MPDYKRVTIIGALPAGDNVIGKLAANDGVDIGNVDVSSIAAGDNNIGNVDVVTLPSLPTGTNIIGEVKPVDNSGNHMASMDIAARAGFAKITDGTETANVNASNQLEVSVENTVPVTGTFYQVTQPVSGTFWQVTQPVSATDLDIRNLAPATDTVKIGDGTETATVNDEDFLETSPEHSLKGKTMLFNRTDVTNGNATLHTVTGGKTLYLLQVGLNYYATAANQDALLWVPNMTFTFIMMTSSATATYHETDSGTLVVTYPHPIPIASGEIIKVDAGASITADGWFIGWEE